MRKAPNPVRVLPLTSLITTHRAMSSVLSSGRVSETPEAPVWGKARPDHPGKYEVADGHHRIAAAIQRGETHVPVELDPMPDDEPYEAPFYDFHQHMRGRA